MATRVSPRSASEATRFTSTTPHASSKFTASKSSGAGASSPAGNASVPGGRSPLRGGETPEERVRRLRAAHQAARSAQVSNVDKALGGGRRVFDFAHRITIAGLLGFTAIAGLVSVYSVYDMVTYNKARRTDFKEAQKQIETDALASARLAFINGTASEEQILLVEDANRAAAAAGVKLPPLLAPRPAAPAKEAAPAAPAEPTLDAAQREALLQQAEASQTRGTGGSGWWPFSSSSASPAASAAAVPTTESIRESAHAAFEKEKANQRQGGPLDQVGLKPEEKKKGWLW